MVIDDENMSLSAGFGDGFAFGAFNSDVARGDGTHSQFVGHPLETRKRADARDQCDVGHRLGQKIVGAGLEPPHPVGRLIDRSDHDDRNMSGSCRPGLEATTHIEPVYLGHHHVQEHDVALRPLADRECLLTAVGGDYVEIFGGQTRLQQLDIGRHVVDDEDTSGHRRAFLKLRQESGESFP